MIQFGLQKLSLVNGFLANTSTVSLTVIFSQFEARPEKTTKLKK